MCKVSPALDFKSLIETMFTLATEGKTNRKGLPNPLRLAVIALGAPLGRMLGYRPTVVPALPA